MEWTYKEKPHTLHIWVISDPLMLYTECNNIGLLTFCHVNDICQDLRVGSKRTHLSSTPPNTPPYSLWDAGLAFYQPMVAYLVARH